MKRIIGIVLLILLFINTTISVASAKTYSNYHIYRIFDLKHNEINWSIKRNNDTKKLMTHIDITKDVFGHYIKPSFILVDKDFPTKFGTDIISKSEGVNILGKVTTVVERFEFKIKRGEERYNYNWGFNYTLLKDGINYLTLCTYDGRNRGDSTYMIMKCDKTLKTLYFIKEYNKLVDKEEFDEYVKIQNQKNAKIRKKEQAFIKKFSDYYDENKLKKSRFGKNTRMKTSIELKEMIIGEIKRMQDVTYNDVGTYKFNEMIPSIAHRVFKYDDNNRVRAYSEYERYVLYVIKEYLYQKEHPEEKQQDNTNSQNTSSTATENQNSYNDNQNVKTNQNNLNDGQIFTNSSKALEDFKKKNADDRNRAISFSKNILQVLEKYSDKNIKLQKIQEIKNILNTRFSPDKYKNQNLIGYVKDYLDIVEYAVKIQ